MKVVRFFIINLGYYNKQKPHQNGGAFGGELY